MGGMERQLLSIASGLLDRGHNVTIISLDESAARPFFESDPRIEFVGLSIGDSTIKATFTERYQRQKKVFSIFKHLKIDVACYGNHEFDYPLAHTIELAQSC